MLSSLRQYIAVIAITFFIPFVNAAQVVNINLADAETIAENLVGIGASKAKAIIDYRKLHGDFRSPDDLIKVKGIGLKLLERNSAFISFGKSGAGNAMDSDVSASSQTPSVTRNSGTALNPNN